MEILKDDHPVFSACEKGDAEKVEQLLRGGVSVYSKGAMTPSLIGTSTSMGHIDVVRVLVERGLDVNRPINRFLTTPLLQAIGGKFEELAIMLVELGADIDQADGNGRTPIETALGVGCLRIANMFVEMNVMSAGLESRMLISAARHNQVSALEFASEKLGVDSENINEGDRRGVTPLIIASKFGYLQMVEWLLEHGADKRIADSRRKTALDYAQSSNNHEIAKLLASNVKT